MVQEKIITHLVNLTESKVLIAINNFNLLSWFLMFVKVIPVKYLLVLLVFAA